LHEQHVRIRALEPALDGVLPSVCGDDTNPPTLLIRNFANGAAGGWFAAGIPGD